MTAENIINFPKPGSREDYFGVCPICRMQNGYLNDGRVHWFVCNTHMTKWCVGSNLFSSFSSWRDETEEQHFAQVDKLTRYREVKEFHPMKPDIVPTGDARAVDDDPPF
jgi:hypothetical protein